MDNSKINVAEKRSIEVMENDVGVSVKMQEEHVHPNADPNTTAGPSKKKLKKRKDVDRTPLMLFNETFPSLGLTLESCSGPSHQPEFVMSVLFEGQFYINTINVYSISINFNM
jgi:hypothetical protein